MGKRLESLSQITTVIQNVAVVIGLLIGGWWAKETFIHQNPAFYEKGVMVAGLEGAQIIGDIAIEQISRSEPYHEVTVELRNLSPTHDQIIHTEDNPIVFAKIKGEKKDNKKIESTFITLNNEISMIIPASQSRKFRALVRFPEKGIYLVEYNPCARFRSDCLLQKYINIE
jgi:hypothetical protein